MNIQTERIFASEAIIVPKELPDILKVFFSSLPSQSLLFKEFTKDVMRTQPTDVVQFAYEWFSQMAPSMDGISLFLF